MLIRRLNETDVEEYHALRLRSLQDAHEAFGSTYEDEVDLPQERKLRRVQGTEENFTLGAFSDTGELIGMASFTRNTGVKGRHKGTVAAMYVAPEARGKGVARAILTELLDRAKQQSGLEIILLDINTKNTAARTLYESLGFEIFGVQKKSMKHRGEYSDEAHLALYL